MRRSGLAVLGLVLLLAAGACGRGQPTEEPSPTPDGQEPTATPTADDERDEPEGASAVTVYFARATEAGIHVEPETHDLDEPTLGVARAAMEVLVAGDPHDPNLSSQAGEGVEVRGVTVDGRVLVVDLSGRVRDNAHGSAGEVAFAQQLAHTAAQFDAVDAVRLWVDGEPISELWGHLDWGEAIHPDELALSPITFDSHRWGEQVEVGRVTVGGEATTFEATVELRLLAPDGSVAEDSFATASEGAPGRGTWEHSFSLPAPGRWTVEAIEPDPSGGEGRPPFVTTLELEVA